ncbi:unnamed protein product, partial [Linum tenue]
TRNWAMGAEIMDICIDKEHDFAIAYQNGASRDPDQPAVINQDKCMNPTSQSLLMLNN